MLGIIYFILMIVGSLIVRFRRGLEAELDTYRRPAKKLVTTRDVYVYQALRTPQFWLIWLVLCLNVTAGIGVLGQASAMSQDMFRAGSPPSPPAASSGC